MKKIFTGKNFRTELSVIMKAVNRLTEMNYVEKSFLLQSDASGRRNSIKLESRRDVIQCEHIVILSTH